MATAIESVCANADAYAAAFAAPAAVSRSTSADITPTNSDEPRAEAICTAVELIEAPAEYIADGCVPCAAVLDGATTNPAPAYTAADDSMIKTATMPSAEKNAAACPASTSTRPAGMSGHAPCLSNSRPPRNVNAAFTSTGPNSSRPAKNAVRPSAPS